MGDWPSMASTFHLGCSSSNGRIAHDPNSDQAVSSSWSGAMIRTAPVAGFPHKVLISDRVGSLINSGRPLNAAGIAPWVQAR